MPSKRKILELLNRNDLQQLVDHFEVEVADRRVNDQLVAGLTRAR